MHFIRSSLKSRLIALTVVIIALIFGMVLYGQQLNTTTSSRNIDSSLVLQEVKLSLSKINLTLQILEKELYEQIISADSDRVDSILHSFDILLHDSESLFKNIKLKKFITTYKIPNDSNYHVLNELSSSMLTDVRNIKPILKKFNDTSMDIEKRYPAMIIFKNFLTPTNKKISTLLQQAIIELKSSVIDSKQSIIVDRLYRDAQYAWSQQTQSIRIFISNRSGVFGNSEQSVTQILAERDIYLSKFKHSINKLKLIKHLKINNPLKKITNLVDRYDINFDRAKEIHLSDDWRSDVSILEDIVQPQIDFIWEEFVNLQILINQLTQESIILTQNTTNKISALIWYSALIILITMITIYYVFEFSLRRPIVAVAKALDAEAKGDHNAPIEKNCCAEMIELLNAFSNMRIQVNTRQTRLQSILDNSLEGIVITNEVGIIESFNKSAQSLFKYSADEVLGQDISMLIPWPYVDNHKEKIQEFLKSGVTNIIGKKRELKAMTKDSTIFPVSVKVTEMLLEDKRFFTAVVEDISERISLMDDLQFQANHDSLTHLFNRYYFTAELEKTVNQHIRGDSNNNAIIYLDLDNFKYVNDTMGHLAGDQLIKEVANLLQKRIRKTDILARLGGDEFSILLYHENDVHLEYVSNCFREILSNYIFKYDGIIVDITCSIGAAYINEDITTKEHLLARADFACHEAKRLGRNQVYIYTKKDDEHISDMSREIAWTRRIRDALAHNKFILACQPIFDTASGNNSYYEVLIRMVDADNKIVLPFGFIPAAERFGLMLEIDAWVVRNAIKLLASQHKFNPALKLSINLSAHSIDHESTFELIRNEIELYQVNPEKILFEVTETIAIANINTATTLLKNIQSLGCKTALDDFGVGYSSFAYLADLPIDVVKIDGFFVKEMANKSLNKTMVRAINDIAHELGKKTVAEFVENKEIYTLLKEINVDYSQGYYLGKPEIVYDGTKDIDDLFNKNEFKTKPKK